MSIISQIKSLEHELIDSRKHAKLLEAEIENLKHADTRVNHAIPLPRTGIDYAFPPYPPLNMLKSAGISFVCRYLSGHGKVMLMEDGVRISTAGQDIVAIWETTGKRSLGGFRAGLEDARLAMNTLTKLKPHGSPPIYFAEDDFDAASEGKIPEVLQYIRGCVHSIGWNRVGLYGGFEVIQNAHAENRCKYLWQTYAWSSGKWSEAAQLRQVQNDIILFGANCDLNKAVTADFGQFKI